MDIGHKVKDVEGYLRYFYFVVIRDEPFRCGSNSCLRSKDARREAKAVFKEPLPLTPFRAQECPTSCKQDGVGFLDRIQSDYAKF